jgi:hypothetical protein
VYFVNDELERVWKEVTVRFSAVAWRSCKKKKKKEHETLILDTKSADSDSNPECKSEVPSTSSVLST